MIRDPFDVFDRIPDVSDTSVPSIDPADPPTPSDDGPVMREMKRMSVGPDLSFRGRRLIVISFIAWAAIAAGCIAGIVWVLSWGGT